MQPLIVKSLFLIFIMFMGCLSIPIKKETTENKQEEKGYIVIESYGNCFASHVENLMVDNNGVHNKNFLISERWNYLGEGFINTGSLITPLRKGKIYFDSRSKRYLSDNNKMFGWIAYDFGNDSIFVVNCGIDFKQSTLYLTGYSNRDNPIRWFLPPNACDVYDYKRDQQSYLDGNFQKCPPESIEELILSKLNLYQYENK